MNVDQSILIDDENRLFKMYWVRKNYVYELEINYRPPCSPQCKSHTFVDCFRSPGSKLGLFVAIYCSGSVILQKGENGIDCFKVPYDFYSVYALTITYLQSEYNYPVLALIFLSAIELMSPGNHQISFASMKNPEYSAVGSSLGYEILAT